MSGKSKKKARGRRYIVRKNPKTNRYVKIDKRRNKIVSNTKKKPSYE